jgi:hypothetical protein
MFGIARRHLPSLFRIAFHLINLALLAGDDLAAS